MPTTSSGSTNAAGSAHTTDTHGTTWAIAAATWRIGAHCARCHRAMLFDEMREVAGAEDAAALLLAAILELGLVRFVHHIHQLCTTIIAFVVCKEINKIWRLPPQIFVSLHHLPSTVIFVAPLKQLMMTSQRLQPNFQVGDKVLSRTSTPVSHSTQLEMPRVLSECGQVGCVQVLQPPNLGISLNGGWL